MNPRPTTGWLPWSAAETPGRGLPMGPSRLQALRGIDEIGVLAALLVLGLTFGLSPHTFWPQLNLPHAAGQASYVGIMVVGMVFVLSLGEVYLSVGSILTLVNILTAVGLREGLPLSASLLLGLGAGAVCGLVNGLLSVLLRIPTIIVTLG